MIEVLDIPRTLKQDRIEVFWRNYKPGEGSVTIICYGCAWTAYFAAMGEDRTIQQFFAEVDTGYLTNKMGFSLVLKQSKPWLAHLGRIIEAVKQELKPEIGKEKPNDMSVP